MKTLVLRHSLLLLLILLAAIAIFPLVTRYYAQSGQDRQQDPPNYDALAASDKSAGARVQTQGQPQMEAGRAVQMEARMGVPTFLWSSDIGAAKSLPTQVAERRATIEATAREHLGRHASRYRLKNTEVAEAQLAEIHDPGMGAIIARFRQSVGGVEVFRDEVKVMMTRQLQLVAISGYITGTEDTAVTTAFNLSPQKAIAVAMQDLTNTTVDESAFEQRAKVSGNGDTARGTVQDPYSLFDAGSRARLQFRMADPARIKQVMFHLPDQFVPAYYIETHVELPSQNASVVSLNSTTGGIISRDYSYVISAIDGQLLFRKNLVADQGKAPQGKAEKNAVAVTSYTYRVWADPATKVPQDGPQGNGATPKLSPIPDFFQAPFVAPSDVSLISGPISTGDPWLPDGATETNGNNADAFLDIASPDGFNGTDFRGSITAPGQFLHTYDTNQQPTVTESRFGAIQQLFYMNNFLHDWYYDVGFNEAAGNGQKSNYGRGGLESDDIKTQGQDFQARNNANMATPADGSRPRMRMYVFDANVLRYVNVISPANIAGKRTNVGTGQFGQQVFDVTKEVVQPTVPAGCNASEYASVAGKFVMVNREPTAGAGSCSIGTKLNLAMAANAAGFILVNLSTTPDTAVTVTGSLPTFTIPFLSVTWNGAAAIKTELAAAHTVTANMRRDAPGLDRDGTIDNQVVAHEWGHYLSNRLIGNAAGINNQQAGGMGEGWGDISSMILSVRADDISVPSNANWAGVYAMAGYVTSGGEENNGYYYGIRRYPYSTDLTKNPLTFKHIQNGNPLPVGPPVAGGADGSNNSEVHNTGEVWATMFWECYAALLRDTLGGSPRLTFQQAQQRIRLYLVTSLKMTPVSPTFTEARDAVLAAAAANDPIDYAEFLQAFAKRGIGIGAVSPDRFDGNNATVVESFVSGKDLQFVASTLDDSPASCDNDGVLDNIETGKLTITLKNTGDGNLGPINATVTSSSPGVTILNGGNLTFPASVPAGQTTATIFVTLNGPVNTVQQLNFTLTYGDPTLLAPTTRTAALSFRANTNIQLANTATDDVESPNVKWTTGHSTQFFPNTGLSLVSVSPFVRREIDPLHHEFFVTDASVATDEFLISPAVTIGGGGTLNVQFDHSYGFEFDGGGNYDGGVVEMSVNGGAWTDIGSSAYTGTILNEGATGMNLLQGRMGFVKNSVGTVHTSLSPTVSAGQSVRIRFRVGTDSSLGAAGWHIDNIAFTGIVESPFDKVVADSGCVCPTTTLSALPSATAGTAYSQTITISPASLATFALTSGLLPPGLSLSSNGAVTGTPTQSGTYNFRITATTFGTCTSFRDYTLLVNCPTITVNPATLPGGTVGTSYNQTVSGVPVGAYNYAVTSGALPPGLSLNAATGVIGGTPTQTGTFAFTVTAAAGACPGSRNYTVVIGCPTISFTTTSPLTAGQAGVAYSQTLNVTPAGSYNFSMTAGSLPSGLTLNTSTGVISGTPITTGTTTFTIKAQAANGCSATQTYTLVIGCPTITVTPASLSNGTTGTAYSQTITASPAGGNYSYSTSGTLPPGLNLNPSTGALSGTPSSNGSFTFTVTATGWGGCQGSQPYTVVIGGGGCATITLPASLPNGSVGQLYTNSVAASPAGSYTYTPTGTLPPGLTLFTSVGLLFGYPTTSGSYTFTVTATAGACSGNQSYTVLIGAGSASSLTAFSDFDGDGKSDLSVFRGSDGNWLSVNSGNGQMRSTTWGSSAAPYYDVTVSGDYDGDGKTDLAVFRRGGAQAGYWYIKRSSDGQVTSHFWGLPTDIPVPGDYDGDGKTDVAVWRGSAGAWYVMRSSNGGIDAITWGSASVSDVPVPGDYDGDGKTDVAVFRQSTGDWYIKRSSDGSTQSMKWGVGTDVAVPGDYDGDGKTDLAVWRASEGNWYIIESSSAALRTVTLGAAGDVPVAADYDGDGKVDSAVWRASTGTWTVKRSSDNAELTKTHGQNGDTPVMARKN